MATEYTSIDISEGNVPGLAELVDEVRRTNRSRVIRAHGVDVAVLVPAQQGTPTKRRQRKGFSRQDSLWNIVGIARSGLTDVSANKKKYLADAYVAESRKE